MADIIVYGFARSTFVNTVGLVLTPKHVPHAFHDLEPEASLVTLNCIPSTGVPMLRHDDFTLNETSAIVGYLEDTFPKPPQPNSIRDRAPGDRKGASRFDLSGSAMEAA